MRKIFVVLFLITSTVAFSQNVVKLGDSVSVKFGGFVRNEMFYDTRKMVEAIDGLFVLYPEKKEHDARGFDLNNNQSANMLAIATRFNALFTGPDVCNAKTSAFFELDFTGLNTTNGVRLRHAWMKMKWTKSELLMGQFWHPFVLSDNLPAVLGLNTGAPYAAFNRSPQLRYTYNFTPAFSGFIAAVYQTASGTLGPDYLATTKINPSIEYIRTAGAPEVLGNLQYKIGQSLTIGATGGMKMLRPRMYTLVTGGAKYKTTNLLKVYNAQCYVAFTSGALKVKASSMYGQEISELNMLGGYAIATRDALVTGHETYTAATNISSWLNITYGKDFTVGLFAGYVKNLGTTENYVATSAAFPTYFGRGENIKYLYRIAPHFSYKIKRFQFGMEFEHNVAAYGTPSSLNKGAVSNTEEVRGMRIIGLMAFFF